MSIKAFAAGVGTCSVVFLGLQVAQEDVPVSSMAQLECPPLAQESFMGEEITFSEPEQAKNFDIEPDHAADEYEVENENYSSDIDDLAQRFEEIDYDSDYRNDLLSDAYALNSEDKRKLADELLTYHGEDGQLDAIGILMRDDGDQKAQHIEFLSQNNLGERAQYFLLTRISDDPSLIRDPFVANWVSTIARTSQSERVRAAAISAIEPSSTEAQSLVGDLTGLLSSSNIATVESGLLATERWVYNGVSAIAPEDRKRIKSRVMAVANDTSAGLEIRIQALSVARNFP